MKSMKSVVKDLAEVYLELKKLEKKMKGDSPTKKNRLPGLKERFFETATEQISTQSLGKMTVAVDKKLTDEEASTEAHRRNPGWNTQTVRDGGEYWIVLMEEDPKYKKFEYLDLDNKLVWIKQIVQSPATLDDEKLKMENPDLWDRITIPKREMIPLEEINTEDLLEVQRFIYPGPLQVKLAAPRKARAEELENGESNGK